MMNMISLFKKFDENDGGMKPEKDCERKCDSLNEDPRHESVEFRLHKTRANFLNLKSEDDPLGEIEKKVEDDGLSARPDVTASIHLLYVKNVDYLPSQIVKNNELLKLICCWLRHTRKAHPKAHCLSLNN